MNKRIVLIIAALLCSLSAFAQTGMGGVKAKVVSRSGRVPVAAAEIVVSDSEGSVAKTVSADDGNFMVKNLPDGDYLLTVTANGFSVGRVHFKVEGYVRDLIFVSLLPEQTALEVDDSNFAEFDMDDSGYQDVPAILSSSSDVFDNIVSYNFSKVRFRQRGYDSSTQEVNLAGVRLNDALTGYTPWSLWSGLNEATREKENVTGVATSDYGVGGYNGVTNIFGNASAMRKGFRISALTNSSFYRLRLMASYATGEMDNGWSIAANVSARVGGNDWVQGVYYRAFAYYLGVEKNWFDNHRLTLSVFGSPVQRGAQNASTQEVYDLVGSNFYNSNWGWQDGKVRNARVRNNHEPVTVLKYTWTPTDKLALDVAAIYRTGKNGYSALDWYDAQDPRPDYYRNLPSYFYNPEPNFSNRDQIYQAGWATDAWLYNYSNTRHVNWDRMYNVNYNSLDENGERRSKYVQEERRTDQHDFNLNAKVKYSFDKNFTLTGGANFRVNRTEYYKIIKDLLGGDYYLNIDSFAERDFPANDQAVQNDLDYYLINKGKVQKVKVGEKYGYDYYANVRDARLWADLDFELGEWKAYAALQAGYNTFWRTGLVRKGLFPDNSKGDSEKAQFFTYRAKLGASWMRGPHRVYVNAGYFNDAPYFAESFVSPRTRNTLAPFLTTEKTVSADVNYAFNLNGYKARITAFYTKIMDQTDLMSFYDDSQNSFTNFAMNGIDQRHVGIELGFSVPIPLKGLSLEGALSWGEYVYTSTPNVIQTVDNDGEVVLDATVPYWASHNIYKKNADGTYILKDGVTAANGKGDYVVEKTMKHYVPSTPQLAVSLGLEYSNNYWFAGIDLQYFDRTYLDMNPLYRTSMAVDGPDKVWTPVEEEYMAAQEKFPHAFVLNANLGKSWYIQRKYNIGFSLQVSNILNNTNVRTGGYEQTRLIDSEDFKRYYRFDSKYFYMMGTNYMLTVWFRF